MQTEEDVKEEKADATECPVDQLVMCWLEYPTETGWWWSKTREEEPEMCCVVSKKTSGDDVVIALFPERGIKRYLDKVFSGVVYQKVKTFNT